ncbi:MAG: PQQ-dependent sugar dehydrogenase [Pirellulaceae bacterium]
MTRRAGSWRLGMEKLENRRLLAAGQVQIATTSVTVDETGGVALVFVERVDGTDGEATVFYQTVNQTAQSGADFEGTASGSVTLGDGQDSGAISIPITDDDLLEDVERFSVSLFRAEGASLGAPRTALVTIVDDEAGEDLVGHWKLDETEVGATVVDASGFQQDGLHQNINILTGGPRADAPVFVADNTHSVLLDGIDDFIQVQGAAGFDYDVRGAFTLSVWVKPTDLDDGQFGIVGYDSGDGRQFRSPSLWRSGSQIYAGFGDGENWNSVTTKSALTANTWNHIAVTFDGTTLSVYANGESVLLTNQFAGRIPVNPGRIDLGRVDTYWDGGLDDVRVYNRALAAAEVVALLGTADVPPVPVVGSFRTQAISSGLSLPTSFDWLPDGRAVVAQQQGTVVLVNVDGAVAATPVLDIRPIVNYYSDRGLLGVAVHPDLQNHPYLYVAYTYDPPETTTQTGAGGPDGNGARVARISRFTLNSTWDAADPLSEVILVGTNSTYANIGEPNRRPELSDPHSCEDGNGGHVENCIAADETSHSVGDIGFGPDGALYASSGDGGSFGRTDPINLRVQSLESLSGKILRIDPLTGQGFSTNPFFDGNVDSNQSKILSYGLRNPFRFAFEPRSGEIAIGDVGWNRWEEINLGAGKNFGWPLYEGGATSEFLTAYRFLSEAQDLLGQTAATVEPPVWSMSHADGAQAVIVGDFVTGNAYTSAHRNSLLFVDLGDQRLRSIRFNSQGEPIATDIVSEQSVGFIVDMKMGVDDFMYYVDLASGTFGKLAFDLANSRVSISETDGETVVPEGSVDSYAVVLDSPPSSSVIVQANWSSPNISVSPSHLTFNPDNWNETQFFEITAVENNHIEGPVTAIVDHAVISDDPNYSGIATSSVDVSVIDNDGLLFPDFYDIVLHEGDTDGAFYSIALGSMPTAPVRVDISVDSSQLVVSPTFVEFTPADWQSVRQVNLRSVDDAISEGIHSSTVSHAITTTAGGFDAIDDVVLDVSIVDNDAVTIAYITSSTFTLPNSDRSIIDSIEQMGHSVVVFDDDTVTAAGVSGFDLIYISFTVSSSKINTSLNGIDKGILSAEPWLFDDLGLTGTSAGIDYGTTIGASIDIVNAGHFLAAGYPIGEIDVFASPADVGWGVPVGGQVIGTLPSQQNQATLFGFPTGSELRNGVAAGPRVGLPFTSALTSDAARLLEAAIHWAARPSVIAPNVGLAITESTVPTVVSENGDAAEYVITLTVEPTDPVTVVLQNDGQLITSPSQVTFDNSNWNVPQAIVVNAIDDDLVEGVHTSELVHLLESQDVRFSSLTPPSLQVEIQDNDFSAGVLLVELDGSTHVNEDGVQDSYSIALTSPPASPVTIELQVDDQIVVSPVLLTFDDSNWNRPQSVIVTAIDDSLDEGNHASIIRHVVTSAAFDYDSILVPDVSVGITDNDRESIDILFVMGSTVPTPYEALLVSHLDASGWTTTMISSASVSADVAGGYDLIYISESISSSQIGSMFNDLPNPIIVSEAWLFDDLGMTGGGRGTDYGVTNGDLLIASDMFHPLFSGLSVDSISIYDDPNQIGWGVPLESSVVAHLASDPTKAAIFAYSPGETLANGSTAAGSRIAIPIWAEPTETLLAILDNAVQWATNFTPPPPAASLVLSETTLLLTEGGSSGSYDVSLSRIPSSSVTVSVSSGSEVELSVTELVFDASNWNIPQAVHVTAVDDAIIEGSHFDQTAHSVTSLDAEFDGLPVSNVSVQIVDNDVPPPLPGLSVLFVAGSSVVDGYEATLVSHFTSQGHTVTVLDDNLVAGFDASHFDLIYVSETVSSGRVGAEFTLLDVPIVVSEPWLYDDLGMTGLGREIDYGVVSGQNDLDVVQLAHPLVSDLSVASFEAYAENSRIGWGVPLESCRKRTFASDPTKAAIFAYSPGETLANGSTAAGSRIAIPIWAEPTETLLAILDNAVQWATNFTPPPPAASLVLSETTLLLTEGRKQRQLRRVAFPNSIFVGDRVCIFGQ